MSAADRHNALARDFVQRVGRETENASELLVVIESTIIPAPSGENA